MKFKGIQTIEESNITPRLEDYSQWYLDVIAAADLAEYGPSKGSMILKPNGYSIWEKTQQILNKKFKEIGVDNVYFPMLIPERLLKKEESHVEGFSPEVAVVTYAGGEKLSEALIVRPTSETIMYETFSRWIRSHRDLPLLINQWANVVRWEMRPRLFLRTTEFLWQEGHTAHSTEEEADAWAKKILDIYQWFAETILAIPGLSGKKSESEKFAGALHTYSVEAMMQDGKALQFATSHNLGQNFSKAFNIQFTNESNIGDFVWQTSWGLSTRTIGGIIMTHSDDKGLILPPRISPIKLIIIPIWNSEKEKNMVLDHSQRIHDDLLAVFDSSELVLDDRDARSGQKHYHWEKRGIPIRIEIGPRDIEKNSVVLVRRDTSKKEIASRDEIGSRISSLLEDIQSNLLKRATEYRNEKTILVNSWSEFKEAIERGCFVKAFWDGKPETEQKIKEETKATVRYIPIEEDSVMTRGNCIFSGKPDSTMTVFAKSY